MTEILHNAFLDDLNDDFVAINAQGTPIGRASTREALEKAHSDLAVTILSASEALAAQPTLAEAATAELDGPFAAIVAQGVVEPVVTEAKPELPADADTKAPIADGSAFDHDDSGSAGGSKAGDESTAHKGAVAKKVAAKK